MKVCLVSPFPPPYGGMAVQAEKLGRLLRRDGYQVQTVPINPVSSGSNSFVSRIPGLRTAFNTFLFLKNLRQSLKNCDAVYFLSGFVNFFFWVTYPALLLIKLYQKPVILSARGGGARIFFLKYKRLVSPILTRLDMITTPSGFLQDAFRDTLGLEPRVVPNIADLEQFEFIPRERFQPKLLVTRNLEPIYDVASILKAFQIVAQKYPQASLGIAGDGSQRKALELLADDLHVADQVFFYGQVDHKGIQKLYQEYDIYVNASRVDNLPGVILEAFASGLPVVSTNAGGIPYIVEHGKTGLLSDVGDCETLAQNVLRVIENPELGQALAQAGQAETVKYTWDHVGPLLREVLEEVVRR